MNTSLGTRLKKFRKNNHLTVKQLCALLDSLNMPICEKSIYKWESNYITPDIKYLNTLATIYNTTIGGLIDDVDRYQSLNEIETKFINAIRDIKNYRQIISLIAKNKEVNIYEN